MPSLFRSLFVSYGAAGAICSIAATLLAAFPAHAQYTYTKVVDNVALDGSGGRYFALSSPALSGDNLTFGGGYVINGSSTSGVYTRINGSLQTFATFNGTTANTPGGGTFTGFTPPRISGSTTVEQADYTGSTGDRGIFTNSGGTLSAIARNGGANSAAPGGGTFTQIYLPSISGNKTTFGGQYTAAGTTRNGIFSSTGGVLSTELLQGSAAPGGGTFSYFTDIASSGDSTAFYANYIGGTGSVGIFLKNANGITAIARTSGSGSSVPGGGTFTNLSGSSVSGNTVLFDAPYSGGVGTYGIFASINGVVTPIATNSPLNTPGGISFNALGQYTIKGDTIAFVGSYTGFEQQAIYTSRNGVLNKVVQVGDALFGSTITELHFTPEGLDNDRLAFDYTLASGQNGIAIASLAPVTVPEAGTLCLALPALSLVTGWVRRRRRKSAG